MIRLISILFLISSLSMNAQGGFSPAVGETGCDAIHKDSSKIISWANQCTLYRGYLNISKKSLGRTSVGDATKPIGKADNFVVSLGDSGVAILGFNGELFNGPGPDFAVFENGFDNYFLELAFVEVSSDGINFFRFPSQSLTDTNAQVKSFDSLDATYLYNLAGKYSVNYGVPFDLEEMKGITGLDIQKITHVKVVDVVGSIQDTLASRDSQGRKVNDPFPTAFPSGGFDLDAVAAIHIKPSGINERSVQTLELYPNPTQGTLNFSKQYNKVLLRLINVEGKLVYESHYSGNVLTLEGVKSGLYFLQIQTDLKLYQAKVLFE